MFVKRKRKKEKGKKEKKEKKKRCKGIEKSQKFNYGIVKLGKIVKLEKR